MDPATLSFEQSRHTAQTFLTVLPLATDTERERDTSALSLMMETHTFFEIFWLETPKTLDNAHNNSPADQKYID